MTDAEKIEALRKWAEAADRPFRERLRLYRRRCQAMSDIRRC